MPSCAEGGEDTNGSWEDDELPIGDFDLKQVIKMVFKLNDEYGSVDGGAEFVVAKGPHYWIKAYCDLSKDEDELSLDMEVFLDLLSEDIDIDLIESSIQLLRELEKRATEFGAYEGVVEARWEIVDCEDLDGGKRTKEFEKTLKTNVNEIEGMLKELTTKRKRRRGSPRGRKAGR